MGKIMANILVVEDEPAMRNGLKDNLEIEGYQVDEARILRIGRSEDEGFEDKVIPNFSKHKERFLKKTL
jgi:DNA-binding response OmpR family regulator